MTDQGLTTIEQMVQREVLCCMSSLISTLAQGGDTGKARTDIESLCDQACELAAPVLDHEEAATQAGWHVYAGVWRHGEAHEDNNLRTPTSRGYLSAREACEANSLDPYEWEVYEHWAVSQWLADKLIAQGERVDTDFAGLNIWARTTTGQSISMDGCIQRIYADMTKPHALDSVAPGA